jgi:DNA-binding response OmpR family regulator
MRILLVEDSAPLRKPVVKALKASGYAVDATGDGAEGWLMAQDHDYDVIILDIMLPGMDGREILKRLRAAGKETPLLFLTAKDAIEDRVAGLRLGADDYLTKSFAVEELPARMEVLGRRKYARRSPLLVVGIWSCTRVRKRCGGADATWNSRLSCSRFSSICCCAKDRSSRARRSRSTFTTSKLRR